MSGIVLVSQSADLAERMGFATAGLCVQVPLETLPNTPEELFKTFNISTPPDVVILDADQDVEGAIALARAIDQLYSTAVVLAATNATDLALSALRAGVADVVPMSADVNDLKVSVDRARAAASLRKASDAAAAAASPIIVKPDGRIVAVVAPKGGVGRTMIATNIAVGLAKRYPQQVVLVDLDLQFGDCAVVLNLEPEFALPDMTDGAAAKDMLALKTLLTRHETGLYVVPGSDSPVAADKVSPAAVTHLLSMLASEFQYIVVDTSHGLSEYTLSVLDKAHELVLVAGFDVPSIRALRKEIEALRALDMLPDARHVVVNFFDKDRGLTVKNVQVAIGEDVDIVMDLSPIVPKSINRGIPLLQANGRDPVTKQLERLIDRVTGRTVEHLPWFFGRRGVVALEKAS